MIMSWKQVIDFFGGEPVYLPDRDPHQPPVLVLHNAGVSLASPLYEKIVPLLKKLDKLGYFTAISVCGSSLLSPLTDVVISFTVSGIPITASVFAICLIISAYLSKNLFEHHHVSVGQDPTSNTAYGLLVDHFGTNLIF
jgi:hypothetical protein